MLKQSFYNNNNNNNNNNSNLFATQQKHMYSSICTVTI